MATQTLTATPSAARDVLAPRRPWRRRAALPASAVLALLLAACGGDATGTAGGDDATTAEPAEAVDFSGQDIELLVGTSAGGGYDAWARQVAPYMEQCLSGNPTVTVRNVTGAGGGVMLNQLFSAEPDGTTFAITNLVQLGVYSVTESLPIDPTQFTMIGQVSDEKKFLFVGPDSEFSSVADVQEGDREILGSVVGLSGGGGVTTIAFFDEIEAAWQPVTHEGSSESTLSVVRGDTDVVFSAGASAAGYVVEGDLVPIFYTGVEPPAETLVAEDEAFAGVENAGDLGMEDFSTVSSEARGFIAPPGMDESTQAALESCLAESVAQEGFEAWLAETGNTLQLLTAAETEAKLTDEILLAMERYADAFTEYLE